ncbi:hypothetical protein ABZ192_29045 [Streptomyces sp. NPDC006235]|uniref:hypothetical protein n=1 Tax=Streptomyces sp. NPDC006235 TaxID=3156736 RepID=UPI00339F45C9
MDAGGVALVGAVAAVVGAAVGAGGAIGSAIVSGRKQATTQHQHWRRQIRRDAYVSFLGCIAPFQEIWRANRERDLLREDLPTGHADRLRGLVRDLDKAALVIELEGPPSVARSARAVERCLAEWQASTAVEALRAMRGAAPRTDLPSSDEMYDRANAAIEQFKEAARSAMGSSDNRADG